MKKLVLILLFVISSLFTNAHIGGITDITVDSPYTAQTLGVSWVLIDSSRLASRCAEEYGFSVGDNERWHFGLRWLNMGPHDGAFPFVIDSAGNRIPDDSLEAMGLHWDSCHGHLHIKDWGLAILMDECGNVIDTGGKVGLNMYDSQNIMEYLSTPFGAALDAWLNQYGVPDYSLINAEPNDDFNGEERLGLSAGFYDTYPLGTWGNEIIGNNRPNGNYKIRFITNASLHFNQGVNTFPDEFTIPITVSGVYPPTRLAPRTITINTNSVSTPLAPYNVTATAKPQDNFVAVAWRSDDTPCDYIITPFNETAGMMMTNMAMRTNGTNFNYPKALLTQANQLLRVSGLLGNGMAKYRFFVRAVNSNLQSADVRSEGQPINVK